MSTLIYTNGVEARTAWLPELRKRNPLRPRGDGFVAAVSLGSEWRAGHEANFANHVKALGELRTYLPCVPMVKFIDEQVGDVYATWLDRTHWTACAESISKVVPLVAEVAPFGRLLVLDFEAYLPPPNRYTPRDGGPYEEALASAMSPLFAALLAAKVRPLILPVPFLYAAAWHAATALRALAPIVADEATYNAPWDGSYRETTAEACAALGLEYMPWFYLGALRLPDFGEQIAKRKIRDYGLFPRAGDDPARFWHPGWASVATQSLDEVSK